jgi:hypothetical protein
MRETARQAFDRLHIPAQNRAMLCLDGGGIRGIMTIQLLKALEEQAGAPCYDVFDMVSGTSTGAIIAGLIASGHTAAQIDALYETFVGQVFTKRSLLSHQFVDPPKWSKGNYRRILKDVLGDVSLRQVCDRSGVDLLITAHDVAEGEETFFSYLHERTPPQNVYGGVLLRAVLEATMSAPTYFTPMERFVDGGTTTFNNPALAAVLEAVEYGSGNYRPNALSVFSFGTGCTTQLIAPERVPNPPGLDGPFWLSWLMIESPNDASDMQSDLLRAKRLLPGCDYRRYQISLDRRAIGALLDLGSGGLGPAAEARLRGLTNEELSEIHLDNVDYFPVMKAIGRAYVEYLRRHAKTVDEVMFGYDLVDPHGRELLVTRDGDIPRIARQMSDPAWVDALPT